MNRKISCCMLLSTCTLLAGCATKATVIGLTPEYPEARSKQFSRDIAFVEVDSCQPTLKWQSFLPPSRHEATRDKLTGRINTITYELKIWRAGRDSLPVELVYERRGLAVSYHKVETPLMAATNYLWTVRARFEIDGQPRVNEWGSLAVGQSAGSETIPKANFYRFATPSN